MTWSGSALRPPCSPCPSAAPLLPGKFPAAVSGCFSVSWIPKKMRTSRGVSQKGSLPKHWLGTLKNLVTGQKASSSVSESLKIRKDSLETNAALAAALRSAPLLPGGWTERACHPECGRRVRTDQTGAGAGAEPGAAVLSREGRRGRPPLSDGRAGAATGPDPRPRQRRSRRGQDEPPGLGGARLGSARRGTARLGAAEGCGKRAEGRRARPGSGRNIWPAPGGPGSTEIAAATAVWAARRKGHCLSAESPLCLPASLPARREPCPAVGALRGDARGCAGPAGAAAAAGDPRGGQAEALGGMAAPGAHACPRHIPARIGDAGTVRGEGPARPR